MTLQIQNVGVNRLAPKTTLGPVSHFTLFLALISIEKMIYAAASHQKSQNDEEISESNTEPPCETACRGSGSNTGTNWKQHFVFQYLFQINQEKEVHEVSNFNPNKYMYIYLFVMIIYHI